MSAPSDRLPHVDEHAVAVAAPAATTWEALLRVVEGSVSARPGSPDPRAEPPLELALAGSHRFSDYALIFRLDELEDGRSQVRAETLAEFPGFKGRVYRALVIGTRMHVLVTRRMLEAAKKRAERA